MIFTHNELVQLTRFSYTTLQLVVARFRLVPLYTFEDFLKECQIEHQLLIDREAQPRYEQTHLAPETKTDIALRLSTIDNPYAQIIAKSFRK